MLACIFLLRHKHLEQGTLVAAAARYCLGFL